MDVILYGTTTNNGQRLPPSGVVYFTENFFEENKVNTQLVRKSIYQKLGVVLASNDTL